MYHEAVKKKGRAGFQRYVDLAGKVDILADGQSSILLLLNPASFLQPPFVAARHYLETAVFKGGVIQGNACGRQGRRIMGQYAESWCRAWIEPCSAGLSIRVLLKSSRSSPIRFCTAWTSWG